MAPRRHGGHVRVAFEDDYDSVKYRSESVGAKGFALQRARQEQRGLTRLNLNTSWAMAQDDPEYALDNTEELYTTHLEQGVFESGSEVPPKKRVRRSMASVSSLAY